MNLCECGCGEAAPIATYTRKKQGYIKGQPVRFISGHNSRGRKLSKESREKIALAARQRGSGASANSWRGGTHLQRGRRMVYVGKEHPMANHQGYVLAHRLVLAASIGRMLDVDEHVHHIDGDETNNEPSNLVLVNRSQHMRIHWLIRTGINPVAAVEEILQA